MDEANLRNCTGCRACEQICPRHCISMRPDPDGFLYPHIDTDRCVKCGLCEKYCPIHDSVKRNGEKPDVFAVWLKDAEKLRKSSSGGAFTALAEKTIRSGGAVFGSAFDPDMAARHICVRKEEDLSSLKGSKYVQSDTGNTFTQAKMLLEQNIPVLYSGTPCQISGLKHFLNRDYENLMTVDLVCHGVPSPLFFRKYIRWKERKMHGKSVSFSFRDKSDAGWGLVASASFQNQGKIKAERFTPYQDPYYSFFLDGLIYRECCYRCPYALPRREGDFTAGDFWGIEHFYPEIPIESGVSLLMANTGKARRTLPELKESLHMHSATLEQAAAGNQQLRCPREYDSRRSIILEAARTENFEQTVSVWKKYYWKKILYAGLKRKVPNGLKKAIKNIRRPARR